MKQRVYYWGVLNVTFEPFVRKKQPESYAFCEESICESKPSSVNALMTKAIMLQRTLKKRAADEAEDLADKLAESLRPKALVRSCKPSDVVLLEDGAAQHHAIVLRTGVVDADILVFSSNPAWATQHREATEEELVLSGFHFSRKTYLCLARRSREFIYSTGVVFPEDRTAALELEFMS